MHCSGMLTRQGLVDCEICCRGLMLIEFVYNEDDGLNEGIVFKSSDGLKQVDVELRQRTI